MSFRLVRNQQVLFDRIWNMWYGRWNSHGTFGTIFDVGHATGPILAGFLIARYDYLIAFCAMALAIVFAIPLFIMGVKMKEAVSS